MTQLSYEVQASAGCVRHCHLDCVRGGWGGAGKAPPRLHRASRTLTCSRDQASVVFCHRRVPTLLPDTSLADVNSQSNPCQSSILES